MNFWFFILVVYLSVGVALLLAIIYVAVTGCDPWMRYFADRRR